MRIVIAHINGRFTLTVDDCLEWFGTAAIILAELRQQLK